VTVNSFLADGGDSFPTLALGTNRLGGEVDTDAIERYLTDFSPVAPGPQNRIIRIP
jgi:5'-nucleotidase